MTLATPDRLRLNRRDRRLLIISVSLALAMVVVLAIFAPAAQRDDPMPSSYGTGNHGAKAAYLTLGKLGYHIERWTDPLSDLSDKVDSRTTLILASPWVFDPDKDRAAVRSVLDHGGRVLAIGLSGAAILPDSDVTPFRNRLTEDCNATPVGLDIEAHAQDVHMRATSYWSKLTAAIRTQYVCDGKPLVVTYASGKGTVVWWADSLPLENRGISMGSNLELLLRSVGPAESTRVYWDESLHGEFPSLWSYAKGTPYQLIFVQLIFVAVLLLLSYSRRSGPLRPDPRVTRTSQSEFVRSLGGLFHKAHATNAAVDIAYQHFRRRLQVQFGVPSTYSAEETVIALQRRLPGKNLLRDLQAAEASGRGEAVKEGDALELVQALKQMENDLEPMQLLAR